MAIAIPNSVVIRLSNQEFECFFGIGFFNYHYSKYKLFMKEIIEPVGKAPLKELPKLAFETYQYNCKKNLEKPKYDYLEFLDLIEAEGFFDQNFSELRRFYDVFLDSLTTQVDEQEADDQGNQDNEVLEKKERKETWFLENVVSFALVELGIPTLDDVYNLTWAEFQIYLIGWERKLRREQYKFRALLYNNTIASHLDPKKIPKQIEKFMPIKGEKPASALSERQRSALKKAQDEYYNNQKTK